MKIGTSADPEASWEFLYKKDYINGRFEKSETLVAVFPIFQGGGVAISLRC
jgi:hypothetical protein